MKRKEDEADLMVDVLTEDLIEYDKRINFYKKLRKDVKNSIEKRYGSKYLKVYEQKCRGISKKVF